MTLWQNERPMKYRHSYAFSKPAFDKFVKQTVIYM